MIVTVEEAKTKRCHESFGAAVGLSLEGTMLHTAISVAHPQAFGGGGMVATQQGGAPFNCIGPKCMAWNWSYGPGTIDGEQLGFCGKAGG